MPVKKIRFEGGEYTENQLSQKLTKEQKGYMDYPEEMLRGMERFKVRWQAHREVIEAHPKLLETFTQSVQRLADGYLQSGHLDSFDSEDERRHIHQQVTEFRHNVTNHYLARTSKEAGKAKGFLETGKNPQPETTQQDAAGNVTINVASGGNAHIYIGNSGQSWTQGVEPAPSAGEIASKGPQRRGGGRQK